MANFVCLTEKFSSTQHFVNMDRVDDFYLSKSGEYTVLDFGGEVPLYVLESPDQIMELIIHARRNHGYGFGADES